MNASTPRWLLWGRVALTLWLAALVLLCFVRTLGWPLVNDGALQHYISFLMDQGMAPYRQLLDMNLPGSLLIDWTVVHTFGAGPLAWRLFDAFLLLSATVAMFSIARPTDWFAGLFAAALFWLLHARDGIGQTGQRDLMEAVLLLAMTAFAFHAVRQGRPWFMAGFGLCAGLAVTIKPDSLLFAALLLLLATRQLHHHSHALTASLAPAVGGFLVPVALVLCFLWREQAVRAFWLSLTEVTPYYASLGRRSAGALLKDCLSAPMRLLALAGLACALATRRPWSWERLTLLLGTLWGIASFLLQGKGYPYHRYPTLGFLLLWVALESTAAMRQSITQRTHQRRPHPRSHLSWPRAVGLVTILYGALLVAPESLDRALHATWNQSLILQLDRDLTQLGGASLSGSVQCLDSISGCNTALGRLGLRQQTGLLSDFLVFGPATRPAVQRSRGSFLAEVTAHPPRILIVTSWLHPSGLPDYAKLALWPAFSCLLSTRYRLEVERSFPPGNNGPLGYRIYVLR